ncbi:hypothetical protein [Cellulophaga sp. Z1A5H]|uniref:hypothetical protein n=1 Tax=Cellulophaga sp. Z1A5H TaxID=2687291 RepID=UPI0013FE106B|nr:hypothetical protein [Cellulophaga sp. Z1A5H]
MNPTLRNILAVAAGILIGSMVNMGIIMSSGFIIPPPTDVDVTTMEGLKASMHLFTPKHFIMPFLAHALGTLAGAFVAAKIAVTYRIETALIIGVFFLIGGVANTYMLPSPTWFTILDILGAYIPMAWLGGRMGIKTRGNF